MSLELQVTSPLVVPDTIYQITGTVRIDSGPLPAFLDGGSVRIRAFATGLTEEAFLDAEGGFRQELELVPEGENPLELALCDGAGRELFCLTVRVRHCAGDDSAAAPEAVRNLTLDPPWPDFALMVKHCLHLAADAADATGHRNRDELFEHVYTQERYAERARVEGNPILYRECFDNLEKYAGYLEQLRYDALPRPPVVPLRSAEDEAREGLERFRACLTAVWKKARAAGRDDLGEGLKRVAEQGQGLTQRARTDAVAVLHETRRLLGEIAAIDQQLAAAPES